MNESESRAHDLFEQAMAMKSSGKFEPAVEKFGEALEQFEAPHQSKDVAECYVQRAKCLLELDHDEDALGDLDAAWPLLEEYGEPVDQARCRLDRATSFRKLGRHLDALKESEHALRWFEDHGPDEDLANCLMDRSMSYRKLGQYQLAFEGYEAARSVLKELDSSELSALCFMGRAVVLRKTGEYEKALEDYNTALKLFDKSGKPTDIARCHMNRAIARRKLGLYEAALQDYKHAMELFDQLGTPREIARCLKNRAVTLCRLGQYDDALKDSEEALETLKDHGLPVDEAVIRMNRAITFRKVKRYDDALNDYGAALELFKEHGLTVDRARCQTNRASSYSKMGQHKYALSDHTAALSLLEVHGLPADIARCHMNRAITYRKLGEHENAWSDITASIEGFESVSTVLQDVEHRMLARANQHKAYQTAVSLALNHRTLLDAFSYIQRGKGRTLLDLMEASRAATNLDQLEQELVSRRDANDLSPEDFREQIDQVADTRSVRRKQLLGKDPAQPLSYHRIIKQLQPGEVLIDVFALDDKASFVFLFVRPGSTEPDSHVEVTGEDLATLFGRWRETRASFDDATRLLLANREADPKLVAHHTRTRDRALVTADKLLIALGKQLLPDLLSHLHEGETLIVSPDGALHGIPLAALVIPATSVRLIERFPIQLTPTATSLALLRERDDDDSVPVSYVGVAPFGGPRVDEAHLIEKLELQRDLVGDDHDIHMLPATRLEVEALEKIFADGITLINEQATRNAVTTGFPHRRVVHLSTHGAVLKEGESLMRYRVLLADGEEIQVREVYDREVPLTGVDLVCLSACHLGNVVQKGSEAIGFTQAFLQGGARVVMAPLWAVDDTATYRLMVGWYRELVAGSSVVNAWQQAAREAIAAGEHPYRWAGFCPSGDGSMVFSNA